MQYLRDVSEMSCGTTAIMQMRLQQDSSNQFFSRAELLRRRRQFRIWKARKNLRFMGLPPTLTPPNTLWDLSLNIQFNRTRSEICLVAGVETNWPN